MKKQRALTLLTALSMLFSTVFAYAANTDSMLESVGYTAYDSSGRLLLSEDVYIGSAESYNVFLPDSTASVSIKPVSGKNCVVSSDPSGQFSLDNGFKRVTVTATDKDDPENSDTYILNFINQTLNNARLSSLSAEFASVSGRRDAGLVFDSYTMFYYLDAEDGDESIFFNTAAAKEETVITVNGQALDSSGYPLSGSDLFVLEAEHQNVTFTYNIYVGNGSRPGLMKLDVLACSNASQQSVSYNLAGGSGDITVSVPLSADKVILQPNSGVKILSGETDLTGKAVDFPLDKDSVSLKAVWAGGENNIILIRRPAESSLQSISVLAYQNSVFLGDFGSDYTGEDINTVIPAEADTIVIRENVNGFYSASEFSINGVSAEFPRAADAGVYTAGIIFDDGSAAELDITVSKGQTELPEIESAVLTVIGSEGRILKENYTVSIADLNTEISVPDSAVAVFIDFIPGRYTNEITVNGYDPATGAVPTADITAIAKGPGGTQTYTVSFTKETACTSLIPAELGAVMLDANGSQLDYKLLESHPSQTVNIPYFTSQAELSIKPDGAQYITAAQDGNELSLRRSGDSLIFSISDISKAIVITVCNENGESAEYSLSFAKQELGREALLTGLTLTVLTGNISHNISVDPTVTVIQLPENVSGFSLSAEVSGGACYDITYRSLISGISEILKGESIDIKVVSEDNATVRHYSFTLVTGDYLTDIKIDGSLLEGFRPDIYEYDIYLKEFSESVTLSATAGSGLLSAYPESIEFSETTQTVELTLSSDEYGDTVYTLNITWLVFEIKSDTLIIDRTNGIIRGLTPGTAVSGLLSQLESAAGTIAVYKNGSSVSSGRAGTQTEVRLVYNGETKERFTVILFGDINGDGIINVLDILMLVQYNSKPNFNEHQMLAANVNRDRVINVLDILMLVQYNSGGNIKQD